MVVSKWLIITDYYSIILMEFAVIFLFASYRKTHFLVSIHFLKLLFLQSTWFSIHYYAYISSSSMVMCVLMMIIKKYWIFNEMKWKIRKFILKIIIISSDEFHYNFSGKKGLKKTETKSKKTKKQRTIIHDYDINEIRGNHWFFYETM